MLYLAYLKTMGYQIFSRSEKHVLWNLTLKSTSPFKRHYLILIEVKVEIPMLPILDFFKFYIFIKFLSVLEPLNTPVSTFNWNHKSNYLKVDKYLLEIVSALLSTLKKDLSLKCPNYRTPGEKIEQSYFKPWNLIPIIEATASTMCNKKWSFIR